MRIKELTVKNFMSVGNQTQAVQFDKENLTLDEIPDKMYDDVFDYLIGQIEKNIYKI